MIRMSSMKNTPVVVEEKTIGILQRLCMDMVQKRVYALNISCGLRGMYTVMTDDTVTISKEFILAKEAFRCRQTDCRYSSVFVRDSTGLLIGYVTDYAISKDTFQICAIEMRVGFYPSEYKQKIWILDYSSLSATHEIVVSSSLGGELIYSIRGNL